jgi:hypothetical protein
MLINETEWPAKAAGRKSYGKCQIMTLIKAQQRHDGCLTTNAADSMKRDCIVSCKVRGDHSLCLLSRRIPTERRGHARPVERVRV